MRSPPARVRRHVVRRRRQSQRRRASRRDAVLKLRQVCCDPRLVSVDAARDVAGSAKLDVLLELVDQQLADGRRVLVFSQFARMLAFQQGKVDVFLISLKAGGAGLNLVGADTVVHYDPWWNPAAQAQATDPAHRIGQTKPVFVYDLIVAGSVEERMLSLQRHKKLLATAILDRGGANSTQLSERDIDDLLAPLV